MKKLAVSLLCIVALAGSLMAQTTIRVNAPNIVAVDEQFNLTFIIEGEHAPSEFVWESGDDFKLVWGPQKGSSTSVSIINGKHTRSSQTTYTYVLMPLRTGTFQLPAAKAKVKGDEVYSKRISVQVVTGQASSGTGAQGASGTRQQSQAETGTVAGEDLFMRLTLSKTNVVVGETVTAVLKLYQRVNIAGFEDARFPAFNGFWSQEVQAPTNIEFHREAIGDLIYDAAVLRSWTLIPQQAGDMTIDPAELVCLVSVRTPRSGSGSIFDSFFQDDYRTIRKRVSTRPVTVHVSKVPAGAPASFGGGVGSFRMTAALSRDSLQTHDAASLKVTVSGKGNISLLEAPKISFPPDFEVYDIKVTETGGAKIFEYPFIPRSHGEFNIGPVEYSYYDVSAGRYVTLTSEVMPIRVGRSSTAETVESSAGQLVANPIRKDVKDLGSDIRFIRTKVPSFTRSGYMFAGSLSFWMILFGMSVCTVAFYLVYRGVARRRADVVGSRSRAATKMARKRLSQAGVYLKGDLYTAFYEELHKALLGFVSDRMTMNAADMSRDNISARLQECGVPESLATGFVSLVEACEFARYAPSGGHEAMTAHYETAVNVISSIDDNMRHGSRSGGGSAAVAALLLMMVPAMADAAESDVADSLWQAGVTAYADGRWADAVEAWEGVAALGLDASELRYNIGNAWFKQSEYARAILNYRRSLKLNPSDQDARFNLEHAESMVQDRIETVPEFVVKTWMRKLSRSLSSTAWSVLFLIFACAVLAMLLLFLLSSSVAGRKTGFYTGIVLVLLAALCLGAALWQRSELQDNGEAVVMTPVVSVGSSPSGDTSKDLFVLHEGTVVKIIDTVGGWYNIELSDGRQGWLRVRDVELI